MPEANIITEKMEIVDSDGQHVGIVERLEDDCVVLAGSGSGDARKHYVLKSLIQDIRGNTVTLTCSASQAAGESEIAWGDRPDAEGE